MKKLLLCIAVSIAITTFVGMAFGLINNQIQLRSILYAYGDFEETAKEMAKNSIRNLKEEERNLVQPNDTDFSDPTEEDFNKLNTEEQKTDLYENNEITTDDYAKFGQRALEETTKKMIGYMFFLNNLFYCIYTQSIIIGILIGTLVYLIIIKQIKSKKIILISLLCFSILFIILHAREIISDINYSINEKTWGIELYNYINLDDTLTILFIVYSVIFIIAYTVNLLYQKKVAKKLNKELDKTK